MATQVALDERLCLALYTASRAMTARYRPLLADLGLTYPQYLVLVLLWEDGPATVGAIGARLQLDTSTLSPLLQRLDAAGLVRRDRGRHDERVVEVSLTDAGEALRERGTAVHEQLCQVVGSDTGDLVRALQALTQQLQTG